MRCKNCGAENDENRYICEICGSPLYDENDEDGFDGNQNEKTQTFSALQDKRQEPTPAPRTQRQEPIPPNPQPPVESDRQAEKKSIIVIAILAVILIAVIGSVIAIAQGNRDREETTSELTRISSTAKSTTEKTTKDETTESTTEKTTEATWIINTSSSGGGETEGAGEYKNGEKVVLIATPDEGYVFDGWYSNGIKVSSDAKYKFKANENASFSAVFSPAPTEAVSDTTATEPTASTDTQQPSIVFGE